MKDKRGKLKSLLLFLPEEYNEWLKMKAKEMGTNLQSLVIDLVMEKVDELRKEEKGLLKLNENK